MSVRDFYSERNRIVTKTLVNTLDRVIKEIESEVQNDSGFHADVGEILHEESERVARVGLAKYRLARSLLVGISYQGLGYD